MTLSNQAIPPFNPPGNPGQGPGQRPPGNPGQGPGQRPPGNPGPGPGQRPPGNSGPGPGQRPPGNPGPGPGQRPPGNPPPRPFPPGPIPPRPRPRDNTIWVPDALIEDIFVSGATTYVTISYRSGINPGRGQLQRVQLIVTPQTRIQDERGRVIRPRDLEEGMIIAVVFSTRMTRSIPPQTQAFEIFVRERPIQNPVTDGTIIQVNVRGQYLLLANQNRFNQVIRFNIAPYTRIFGIAGQPIALNNLFPGLRIRVEYSAAMTASIPPQTTAITIQVIR